MAQATHRNPACLPEQLLWSALGSRPDRVSAWAEGAWIGGCAPQTSAAASSPARASMCSTNATSAGPPACEADAGAHSSSPKPDRAGGPGPPGGEPCRRLDG